MEVMTMDRPGLLSGVGQALMDCGVRLHNAKITTFGARVEDVFYLTNHANKPLADVAQLQCLRETIINVLDKA